MFADAFTDAYTEFMTTDVLGRFLNETFNNLHCITTIALKETVTAIGL